MLKEQMLVIVQGLVQGVGFRATTKKLADRLQIQGYVKNKSDGSVEICAQGTESQLKELITSLNHFFGEKHIEKMDTFFGPILENYKTFQIT